jgi:hypothetical protein
MKDVSVDEWLASQPSTLWGRAFNIKDPSGLEDAAQWFREQLTAYADWAYEESE